MAATLNFEVQREKLRVVVTQRPTEYVALLEALLAAGTDEDPFPGKSVAEVLELAGMWAARVGALYADADTYIELHQPPQENGDASLSALCESIETRLRADRVRISMPSISSGMEKRNHLPADECRARDKNDIYRYTRVTFHVYRNSLLSFAWAFHQNGALLLRQFAQQRSGTNYV